ncbi:N-acetyltransferase [Mycoplasmatota bacterium WC44]
MKIKNIENRIVCLLDDKEVGYIDYHIEDYIVASYIFVEPDSRDTNAKNLLLDELMKLSDEKGLKIEATCSYMNHWFNKHKKEYLK